MRKVSYCTTCKGRLWQLKRTLPVNLMKTGEYCEIIILDYHSDDGLEKWIKDKYQPHLNAGRLKYYKLKTPVEGFDMAFAKHITHMLSDAEMLFNLDADNFIGKSFDEMQELKPGQILVARKLPGTATSRGGRIGLYAKDYYSIGGYEIRQLGMIGDDGLFLERAKKRGGQYRWSTDTSIPIQQSEEYKQVNVVRRENGFMLPTLVEVEDHEGVSRTVNLMLEGAIR